MSQEERIKRRKRKKKIKLSLFSVVLIYFFFRSIPSLFAFGPETVLPERCNIYDKIETEGIIIRDESIYMADAKGELKIIAKEGERVPVGAKILELALLSDTSHLKEKLEEIEGKIEILSKVDNVNSEQNNFKADVEETSDNIIDEIQVAIIKGDYVLARSLKDKISNEQDLEVYQEDTLVEYSLDALVKEREKIEEQISNSIIDYYSKNSGIVSYKIDGYEGYYSVTNEDIYKYSDFENINNQYEIITDGDSVEINQPIFKIINNFQWYVLIKIDDVKDIESYEEGDNIILTGKDVIGELKGYIERIDIEGNKGVILCKFNTDFENYYDKRHVSFDIVKDEYETYKINKKSIIEENGIKGVYIKDINGIVRFRAIEILREDDQYAYISIGDKNGYIYIGEDQIKYRTVREFDEILLNPTKVEEGTIIN